jgi:DNA-binding CsgD family transcriptional regulator
VSRLEALLRNVTEIAESSVNLAERRHALIQSVGNLVGATAGFWGWGRGNPVDSAITPLAALSYGMTHDEWQRALQMSLGAESVRLWSLPIRQRMQETAHVTVTRSMLHSDDAWAAETNYRRELAACGMENLLVSVHFYSSDCWFNTTLGRPPGAPDFSAEDAALLDLAMRGVIWMEPRVSETVPPEMFVGLTPRQRVVMHKLLDGQSRKQIASHLGITLHTANDHIKAIYERFQVGSATELAAKFLQSH